MESWKEISTFIGRDVRTAMRWAAQGMPIHRIPGAKRSRVYAFRWEIDAWLQGQRDEGAKSEQTEVVPHGRFEAPPASSVTVRATRLRTLIGLAVLATTAIGLAAILAVRRSGQPQKQPVKVDFRGDSVVALDAANRELWSHHYAGPLDPAATTDPQDLQRFVRFVDLDGDGKMEIILLAPTRLGPNPLDGYHTEVDCFTAAGELLWSYVPAESFQFGEHRIDYDWRVSDIFVSPQGVPRIWVSVFQNPWGNSFVAELDPRSGKPATRFVNTGMLYVLNEVVDGGTRYLLAGGFNNEYESGTLALIDERIPFAASPQSRDTRHHCDNCPEGSPNYLLVFPRGEVNQITGPHENQIGFLVVRGQHVQAVQFEIHRISGVSTHYEFRIAGGVTPISKRFDSPYDTLHRELSEKGQLTHSLEECPERANPAPVRMWTPSRGWTPLEFPAAKATG